MNKLWIIFVSIGFLNATSIDKLVRISLHKNHSLKTIKHKIQAQKIKIRRSQNLKNPDISLTLNDIQFNNPLSRSLEPMQTNAMSIKQQFTSTAKLRALKRFEVSRQKVIISSLNVAKVQLAKEVRLSGYTIKEIEARIAILYRYKKLIKQNITLYTSYASSDNKSHLSSMTSSLILSKIKIKLEKLKSILNVQKSMLRYFVEKKISKVSHRNRVKKPKSLQYYLRKAYHNPSYKQKQLEVKRATSYKKNVDLSLNPDPYVKVGYYNRANYADYASVTVGFSLPLYSTEKQNIQIAKREILESRSRKFDYLLWVKSEIKAEYFRLKEAYNIYRIIKNTSLKELEHMFELSQSHIQDGGDAFTYISLLEQKLTLEEELVTIKAHYFRSQVRLNSLIGKK